ncbi:hypothetical protein V2L05_14640 [Pseudomonas alliivorans]|nr:hypothetical protein [Pseudomonas alliivorans]
MIQMPQAMFDIYGLALPWGLGFVGPTPLQGWFTADGASWGVVTFDDVANVFGCLAMRQRVDLVWTKTLEEFGFASHELAYERLCLQLIEGAAREPMPSGVGRRPNIYKSGKKKSSSLFNQLSTKRRKMAAWMIGYLYYALPKPDANWVPDFQSENLHTRLWELHLLACFREQGRHVSQDYSSPDFNVSNRMGESAWIEAVTTNPTIRYDHATTSFEPPPTYGIELFLGEAAKRYAGTISNKLNKRYHEYPHVSGQPFALAIADFHAQGSMTWSRPALIAYLYGFYATTHEVEGVKTAARVAVSHLLSDKGIRAGLFVNGECNDLSAVIFSNGCSIQKFGRVLASASQTGNGYRMTRFGSILNRTPGALEAFDFCLDVTSQEYRDLWPQGYEPWSAELEVFHNPHANYPFPKGVLPEATHWTLRHDEMLCEAFYETQILSSRTLVQRAFDRPLSLEDVVGAPD